MSHGFRPREYADPLTVRFAVGDRVKWHRHHGHGGSGVWWMVRAASDRFAVLTAPAPFYPKGTRQYTIVDYQRGVRGPCNLLGGGYGDGSYSTEQCAKILAELEIEPGTDAHGMRIEVSARNAARVLVEKHVPAPVSGRVAPVDAKGASGPAPLNERDS
jgi:hypothetical protein